MRAFKISLAGAFFLISFIFLFWIGTAPAEEQPSAELMAQGRALFTTKDGLHTKFACVLCHQKEKVIKKADIERAGDKLPTVINKYITTKAKGPAIAPDSQEMKALIAYIRYEHSK